MGPTTETEQELPDDLFKLLSEAAVASNRTVEEEIITRLEMSLDREETETEQQQ